MNKVKMPNPIDDERAWLGTRTDRAVYDEIKARAKNMRQNPTPAEAIVWNRIRRKQLLGFRFRRQHPIDRFIADFYCREARLVIEIDGLIHDLPEQIEYDAARQTFLEQRGLRLLRFTNAQVINSPDSVISTIVEHLSR